MSIKALTYILNNDAAYKSAIGTTDEGNAKIFPDSADQGTSLPYGTIKLVSRPPENNKDERGATTFHYQIDHYASNALTAEDIEAKFEAAIAPYHSYKSVVNGVNVRSIRVTNGGGSDSNKGINQGKRRMIEISMRINP